jgi:hypothetical protein
MTLTLANVKDFIRKKRVERWELFWRIKSEIFSTKIRPEMLIELSRDYARVEQELKEAKAMLPKPWWRR